MLPILMSVSDAPGSYFFWARALPQVAVNRARAAAPNRQQIAVIPKFRFRLVERIACVSVFIPSDSSDCNAALLGGDVAADDLAEQLPLLSLELLHLQLGDRGEVG